VIMPSDRSLLKFVINIYENKMSCIKFVLNEIVCEGYVTEN